MSRSAPRPRRSTADHESGTNVDSESAAARDTRATPPGDGLSSLHDDARPSRPGRRRRGHDRRLGLVLREDGRRRPGRRPRAGPRRDGRELPRRRDRPGPGRDAGDRRAGQLVDRLLPPPGRDDRHRLRLPRAGLPDPRGHRGRRAGRPRARRDAAGRGPRRPLADRGRGRDARPHALRGRPPRRQLPRDRRPHRPAAQRPCLLARDAGGGRRAARADGVPRPPRRPHAGRRPARDRRRDERAAPSRPSASC